MLAADYLVYKINTKNKIDSVAVRPNSLFDEEYVSELEIHNTKLRNPIFNTGKTTRINDSNFMVELLSSDKLWQEWEYKTSVI